MTVYFPFTICTEDYAKYGVASEYTYHCELEYPITNINDGNRQSYAKFNAAATKHAGFNINLGSTLKNYFVILELSRPYEFNLVEFKYHYAGVWYSLVNLKTYKNGGTYYLPGQIKQYIILSNDAAFSADEIRILFDDCNSAHQIEIRRVIVCNILQKMDGVNTDMFGPGEQSHQNVGKVLVPLIHGNSFRTQSYGALKQDATFRFPEVKVDQVKLLEDLESDYQKFGILDWTGRFIECVIIPNGLTIKHNGVDAIGTPFFDVTMRVQEV